MQIFDCVKEWQKFRGETIFAGKKLGLVPTMGNLHAGHKSLLERSVTENDYTVLTLFVNPTQFDDAGDFKNYPRTFEQDIVLANKAGVDFVLTPNDKELYTDNYRYKMSEAEFSKILCGKHRPGHFDGVLTVVLKLLQLVKAQRAYFGEKDFQQLQLIKGMVEAFFLDVEIVPCPIVRDEQGLALSSRNSRLTPEQYRLALNFPRLLSSQQSLEQIKNELTQLGLVVDYIEEHLGRRFGAVRVGDIRLIDNIAIAV